MKRPPLLIRIAALFLLLSASGCWPGAAIIGGLAAAGGGGGGSSGGAFIGNVINGTIIVGSTNLGAPGLELDHEPNDAIGYAGSLGSPAQHPVIATGETRLGAEHHLLIPGPSGQWAVVVWDALANVPERVFTLAAGPGEPRFIARSGGHLYVLRGGGSERVCIQEYSAAGGVLRGAFETPSGGAVRGFAAGFDVLMVLIRRNGQSALAVLDPDSGEQLSRVDLGAEDFVGVAAGEELTLGQPRLFTAESVSGHVHELAVSREGGALSFGPSRRSFASGCKGVTDLSYDGALLYLAPEAGDGLQVLDPEAGAAIARLDCAGPLRSVTSALDLGLDGYRAQVDPARGLEVELRIAPRDARGAPNHMFLLALDRHRALTGRPGALLVNREAHGAPSAGRTAVQGTANPYGVAEVDLIVGAFAGGGVYQVLAGAELGSPDLAGGPGARPGPAPAALRRHLAEAVFSRLDGERLAEIYLDTELPEHYPGQIAVGVRGRAAPVPASTLSFALEQERRSPSGWSTLEVRPGPAWQPRPALRVGDRELGAAKRREAGRELLVVLGELAGCPELRWCEPVYKVRALGLPNDAEWAAQAWHMEQLRLPEAWDTTTGSGSVVVGVVDSGVRRENDDLSVREIQGQDLVTNLSNAGDGDGIDSDPYDESGAGSHGTHVGGTACAAGDNGFGVAGVMWNCLFLPVRAIGVDGSGSTLDIAEGIRYAAGQANLSGNLPPQRADVINLSLGSRAPSQAMSEAIAAAVAQGIVVVAASGNDGIEGVLFPASSVNTIAVGATNSLKELAFYSNTGPQIDVVAPGGNATGGDANNDGLPDEIYSCQGSGNGLPPGTFGYQAGTSMACAHVSGVAGLLKGLNPNLGLEDVRSILRGTAEDLEDPGDPGDDTAFGAGLVDAAAAVSQSQPILKLSADALDFGINGTRLVVQAFNVGFGGIQITRTALSDVLGGSTAWLTTNVESDGRTLSLSADRAAVADGTYQVRLTVTTTAGSGDVLLAMTKAPGGLPDVGTVVVELTDAASGLLGRTTTSAASAYGYSLAGVPLGTLGLSCGVDSDADGVLCEPGEPCGHYPTADDPGLLLFDELSRLELDLLLE